MVWIVSLLSSLVRRDKGGKRREETVGQDEVGENKTKRDNIARKRKETRQDTTKEEQGRQKQGSTRDIVKKHAHGSQDPQKPPIILYE